MNSRAFFYIQVASFLSCMLVWFATWTAKIYSWESWQFWVIEFCVVAPYLALSWHFWNTK